jgi:cytochrome b561
MGLAAARAARPAAPAGAGPARYGRVAAWLHWAIGIALLGQMAFGFLLDEIAPRGSPARSAVINLHKSIGIVLGILIVARIVWRVGHAPPAWPDSMSNRQQRAAALGHRTLYGCMLAMPLAGYVGSNFSKHGIRFFGVPLAPWGPDWPAAYSFFVGVHVATAFLFAALIAGHVAMALKHALVERDSVFSRIVP